MTGKKKAAVSHDMDLAKIKKVAKEKHVTFNDIMMGLAGMSLKEFMEKKGDYETENLNLCIPFSLRTLPDSPAELQMQNEIAVLMYKLRCSKDLDASLKVVHHDIAALRNSAKPLGNAYEMKLLGTLLPTILCFFALGDLARKLTLVWSNVAGPKKPLTFNGKKTQKIFYLVPALGKLTTGISIISHENIVKLGFMSDTCSVEDPRPLVDIFEANYKKYILKE